METLSLNYEFLMMEADFANKSIEKADIEAESNPGRARKALMLAEEAVDTIRRLIKPDELSERELTNIVARVRRLEWYLASRMQLLHAKRAQAY